MSLRWTTRSERPNGTESSVTRYALVAYCRTVSHKHERGRGEAGHAGLEQPTPVDVSRRRRRGPRRTPREPGGEMAQAAGGSKQAQHHGGEYRPVVPHHRRIQQADLGGERGLHPGQAGEHDVGVEHPQARDGGADVPRRPRPESRGPRRGPEGPADLEEEVDLRQGPDQQDGRAKEQESGTKRVHAADSGSNACCDPEDMRTSGHAQAPLSGSHAKERICNRNRM